jgi:hypothetical protein
MYVIVQVAPPAAVRGPDSASAGLPLDLKEAASRLGIDVRPMHPGVDDPALARYFYVEAPDQPAAERVIAQLQKLRGVEAAFLKPPEGPP